MVSAKLKVSWLSHTEVSVTIHIESEHGQDEVWWIMMYPSWGQIFVLTTNHRDRLNPALIRNGRADLHIEFSHATDHQIAGMWHGWWILTWSDSFRANFTSHCDIMWHCSFCWRTAVRFGRFFPSTQQTCWRFVHRLRELLEGRALMEKKSFTGRALIRFVDPMDSI